jgi:hypothetical protein
MPFLRYSEGDVRRLLARAIRIRWPDEGLLLVTGCRAERSMGTESASAESERGGWRYYDHDRRGYLAATPSRLIYQDRTTPSSVIMGTGVLLGVIAVVLLLLGNDLRGWFFLTATAALLWMLGVLVEAGAAGGLALEFDKILHVESGAQRMVALGRAGHVLTLHIDDPSDFRMVAALVSGLGNAAT